MAHQIPWQLDTDMPCKSCGHMLQASHVLYLMSSEMLNQREARCQECSCVLTNYRRADG